MAGIQNDAGVSVIIGTLLLILITVTAAAGLAMMVSQMQKDEMNRQTHLAAVKNENIVITNVFFENNETEWHLSGSKNWSSVKFTLVNMNTNEVRIVGIAINGRYALNFTDKSRTDPDVLSRHVYNSSQYLTLPSTGHQDVYIDFVANASEDPAGFKDYDNAQSFGVGTTQNIKVATSLTNFFETTLKPPNPIIQTKIETGDSGKPDSLILDGSQSTADSTILSYNWTIYDLSWTKPYPGNETDESNYINHNQTHQGRIWRTNNLNNTMNYRVMLTISDALGMSATSPKTIIPPGNFNPPVSMLLNWSRSPDCLLNVTILDRLNNGVFEQPVDIYLQRYDDNADFKWKLISPSNGMTFPNGSIFFSVSGNATVIITSNKLERPYKFEGNNCPPP